jgi:hypothetical protein
MTNITRQHRDVFDALISGKYRNFALFSCVVNGEPGAAIVTVNENDGVYNITPLFVSVTPGMALADHDGALAAEFAVDQA